MTAKPPPPPPRRYDFPSRADILRRGARLAAAVLALGTAGCSAADVIDALVPSDGYRLAADRPYGPEPRQRLDVYSPAAGQAPWPVVVFFYGGNWRTGDKGLYRFLGEALATRGFLVVVPDYRLFPAVRYPGFLADGAAATGWTIDHLATLGGDPRRVYLMGHSAGAYIALMLALDGRWLGPRRARIAGTIGLAGPYDFLPITDPEVAEVFGAAARDPETQPIAHADGSAAPVLLISGLGDSVVDPGNSRRLARRLRARGGTVREIYYRGTAHSELVAAMAAPLHWLAPTLDDVVTFLRAAPPGA